MIITIVLLGLFAIIAFVLVLLYAPKLVFLLIPLLFLIFLGFTIYLPNYLGYAISDQFVQGKEATVLDVVENKDNLFLLVQFTGEKEPRLVFMPNTQENKDKAEKAKDKDGGSLIRFGQINLENPTGAGAGFDIIGLEESKAFSKDVQP